MIRIACPGCDKMLRIPDAMTRRMVACPQCKKKFRVPEQETTDAVEDAEEGFSTAPLPAKPRKPGKSRPPVEEVDEPPVRKRRPAEEADEDEDAYGVQSEPSSPAPRSRRSDERPLRRRRRSISRFDDEDERPDVRPHRGTLILILGILSLVFGCIPLVGWILGGITMSMGSTDERLMEHGSMMRSGRGLTKVGYILGVIGVFLATASFIFGLYWRFRHMALR